MVLPFVMLCVPVKAFMQYRFPRVVTLARSRNNSSRKRFRYRIAKAIPAQNAHED